MFEDDQSAVAELLQTSPKFRALYEQHESLKEQVHDAQIGVHPMGDLSLTELKKRKLLLKDQMARMLHSHHVAAG